MNGLTSVYPRWWRRRAYTAEGGVVENGLSPRVGEGIRLVTAAICKGVYSRAREKRARKRRPATSPEGLSLRGRVKVGTE